MVRAGLSSSWTCTFANDIDSRKAQVYSANWGDDEFYLGDIAKVTVDQLGRRVDLAWASFPCQDLSLAGLQGGLNGTKSAAFWGFWKLMKNAVAIGRAPRAIVLENVCGIMSSHGGNDFRKIISKIAGLGYVVGALVMDARDFVPQSRRRVFIVAFRDNLRIPRDTFDSEPNPTWHPPALVRAVAELKPATKKKWRYWSFSKMPKRSKDLKDVVSDALPDVVWHSKAETKRLLKMMAPLHRSAVSTAKSSNKPMVGAVFKRMRPDSHGQHVQRAEVSFTSVAGCLRTPAGGSSLQSILSIKKGDVRSRLLSPRETARLMGLKDSYKLPELAVDAYRVTGDGVVAPVVRHLAKNLLERVLVKSTPRKRTRSRTR